MLSYCHQLRVLFIFIDFTWDFKFSHMTLMVSAFFWLCHVVWQIGVGILGLLLLLNYSGCEDSKYLQGAVECLQGCTTLCSEGA